MGQEDGSDGRVSATAFLARAPTPDPLGTTLHEHGSGSWVKRNNAKLCWGLFCKYLRQ